jgi:hypothetical protein
MSAPEAYRAEIEAFNGNEKLDAQAPSGGDDELESLLAQFDAQTAAPAETANDAPQSDASAIEQNQEQPDGLTLEDIFVRHERATLAAARETITNAAQQHMSQLQQEAHNRDMPVAVKEIRGALDQQVFSDDFVQTWIDNKARGSMALQQAWLDRAQDPQMWRAAQRQLGREFYDTFSNTAIDPQLTEDRFAVAAAVRGASSNAPVDPPVRYGQLSNSEFTKDVRDKYGFDPGI